MKAACHSQLALLCIAATLHSSASLAVGDDGGKPGSVYSKDNLVAWCIVPFDAKQRRPAERADMLERLGIGRVAYDWRDEHVPMFETEIQEYRRHGIEFFAFWSWHDNIAPLIEKHHIKPQIWLTCPSPKASNDEEMIVAASRALEPLANKSRGLGLKLGLYNHGGWGGEPANLVAVCDTLREATGSDHIGIVYNFHHGHGHIDDFAEALRLVQPYLLCLNLNGMNDNAQPKILPIGSGQHDQRMLQIVRDSGYDGPIGILDHRAELDAEESLRQNLDGLQTVLRKIGDEEALATFGQ